MRKVVNAKGVDVIHVFMQIVSVVEETMHAGCSGKQQEMKRKTAL